MEQLVNPTFPDNIDEIENIFFERVKLQTTNAPRFSKESNRAPWFSFSKLLKDCGVDEVG